MFRKKYMGFVFS